MNTLSSTEPPGTATSRRLPSALAALGHLRFRWLFASNTAFFFAMTGQQIVRAWITYDLTRSELALGAVSFAVALPMLLFAPVGGVLADTIDRRLALLAGQSIILIVEICTWALLLTGQLRFWHLLMTSGLMGCVFPLIMPARQALSASIVGRKLIGNAMALSVSGMNVARVVGPSLAAFLIGVMGPNSAYGVGVILYLVALAAGSRIGPSPPPLRANRGVRLFEQIAETGRYLRTQPTILSLLLFGLLPMLLAMPFQMLLVVFAEDVWETGPSGLAILSGAAGIGGLGGSVYIAWSESVPRLRFMTVMMIAFCLTLAGFSLSPWFLVAVPLLLAANVFQSIFGTLNNTAIQLLVSDELRGRVSSVLLMTFSLPRLGTLPMSAVAEAFGARVAVAGAAVLALGITIASVFLFPSLRATDGEVRRALRAGS